jgi:hypothetical protein
MQHVFNAQIDALTDGDDRATGRSPAKFRLGQVDYSAETVPAVFAQPYCPLHTTASPT